MWKNKTHKNSLAGKKEKNSTQIIPKDGKEREKMRNRKIGNKIKYNVFRNQSKCVSNRNKYKA